VPLYGVVASNKTQKPLKSTHLATPNLRFTLKKALFCLWLWATTPDNGSAHKPKHERSERTQ
jgi:hypothetical protein